MAYMTHILRINEEFSRMEGLIETAKEDKCNRALRLYHRFDWKVELTVEGHGANLGKILK